MLMLKKVDVNIGSVEILRQVNLEVGFDQRVGLVGRNGAGKTTTIKSIVGLMQIASGNISFIDSDLLSTPVHKRAALGIGYVPEESGMLAMTVKENLMLPVWASHLSNGEERLKSLYQLIPEAQKLADRSATQLSGGEQKIVAFTRALMTGTKLLLLDEPFEGLSPLMSEKFTNLIQKFQEEELSMLIAESNVNRVKNLVGKVYHLERGEIIRGSDGVA